MILEVNNVSKSYGTLRAVNGVSFSVKKSETLSIVGESGCGKTTLARMIAGLIPPDSGRIVAHDKVQMVFQDPQSSLDPMYNIRAILNEAFYAQKGASSDYREAEMGSVLVSVGLDPNILTRFPHQFSGGQRQRIAIARALLAKPEILILDEPTSALDVLVQKQIIDLLTSLRVRMSLTYVFISHNLRVVKSFSDTILVMHKGRIIESGRAQEIYANPTQAYTKQLLSAALNYE